MDYNREVSIDVTNPVYLDSDIEFLMISITASGLSITKTAILAIGGISKMARM